MDKTQTGLAFFLVVLLGVVTSLQTRELNAIRARLDALEHGATND